MKFKLATALAIITMFTFGNNFASASKIPSGIPRPDDNTINDLNRQKLVHVERCYGYNNAEQYAQQMELQGFVTIIHNGAPDNRHPGNRNYFVHVYSIRD